MPAKLNKRNNLTIVLSLISGLLVAATVQAGSPVIIRHDAHLMEREIRINLAWQSEEPVAKIIASAGKEQIIIDKNIDNDRNEGGYSGEIDVIVPAYPDSTSNAQSVYISQQNTSRFNQSSMEMSANTPSPYSEVVQYSIQLVDEVNQRSTLLNDKVHRSDSAYALANRKNLQGDQQSHQPPLKSVAIDAKDPLTTALNTTIGLIGKIGSNPEIKDAKVSYWTEGRVSVNFNAIDDKGVEKVVFEVRDIRGDIAYQNSLLCASEKQCNKQTDTFTLNPGKYMLSAFAVDTDNNNSKKMTVDFQVSNSGQQSMQPPPQQVTKQPAPQQTAPGEVSSDDAPVVIPGL